MPSHSLLKHLSGGSPCPLPAAQWGFRSRRPDRCPPTDYQLRRDPSCQAQGSFVDPSDRAASAVTDRDLGTVLPLCAFRTMRLESMVRQGPLSSGDTPTPTFSRSAGFKPESHCFWCHFLFKSADSFCTLVPGLRPARVFSASLLTSRRPLGDASVFLSREQVERPWRAGCRPIGVPAFDFIEGYVGQSLAGHTWAQAAGRLPRSRECGAGAGARPTGAALVPADSHAHEAGPLCTVASW